MAQNEQINAVQDTTLEVDAANGVLANDPGATLVFSAGEWLRTSAGGQISFDDDGSYYYISAPGFSGTDTVQYTTDNAGTGTLTINVAPTALLPFVSIGTQLGERHQITLGFAQVGDGVSTSAFAPVVLRGGGYVVLVDYQDIAAGSSIEVRTYDANHNLVSVFDPGTLITGARVAALPDGGYAFAYGVRDPNAGTQTNYLQRFDAAGHSLSGPALIDLPGDLEAVAGLSALPNGGVVLLQVGDANQLYARSFDANGVPESQSFAIGDADQSRNPTILPNGQIVLSRVVNDNEVHLQRFDVHGNPIGAAIVPTSDGNDINGVRTIARPDGGFVVFWNSFVQEINHQMDEVSHVQIVDAAGQLVGDAAATNLLFTTLFGVPNSTMSVTPLTNGGFVVRWRGLVENGEVADRVQAFDASGNEVGSPFFFSALGPLGTTRALVFALPEGGFAVTLQSADPENHNLYIYDNNGSPVGEVRMHDLGDGTTASSMALVNLPNGNTLIVGHSYGTDSLNNDIWAQTIRFDTPTPVIEGSQPGGVTQRSAVILPVKIYIPDPDGSEIVQSIEVSGVPAGWTLSHPSATASFNAGVWTVTGPGIAQGGAIELHLRAPSGTTGSGTLSVVAHTIDTDNGSQNQSFPASFNFAHLPANKTTSFDFSGDGKHDLLFQNADGTPAVWLLDGTGVMTMGPALPNPNAGQSSGLFGQAGPWRTIDAGDFNGDGKADILWQHTDGRAAVWLMDGTGVMSMGSALANPGPSWKAKEAADFDGDGKSDILWQNDNGTSGVWLMDGVNTKQIGGALPNPGAGWNTKASADFNGDGKADILWQHDNGATGVWLMDGTAVLQMGGGLNPGSASWHAEAAGDFNGDGKADILWQHTDGTAAVWLMDGTTVLSMGGALANPGPTWHVKEAVDTNGDGKADIVWQSDNGTPGIWLMNGTNVAQIGGALANPGAAWHIV